MVAAKYLHFLISGTLRTHYFLRTIFVSLACFVIFIRLLQEAVLLLPKLPALGRRIPTKTKVGKRQTSHSFKTIILDNITLLSFFLCWYSGKKPLPSWRNFSMCTPLKFSKTQIRNSAWVLSNNYQIIRKSLDFSTFF